MQQQDGSTNPGTAAAAPVIRRASLWSLVLGMTVSPGTVLARGVGPASPIKGLGVAALAFALFFGLSGLESGSPGAAVGFGLLGALIGVLGVLAAAVPVWIMALLLGAPRRLGWSVSAFGLSYAPMLIHAAAGLFFNVALGWNTAVAFGASGLLWSIRPLFMVSRNALGDRPWLGLVLSTACGGAMLLLWAACFGNF
jgi:hypothetical protein